MVFYIFEQALLESSRQGSSAVIEAYQLESNRAFVRSSETENDTVHDIECKCD